MKKLAILGKPRYNRRQTKNIRRFLLLQEMNTESDIQRRILCVSLFLMLWCGAVVKKVYSVRHSDLRLCHCSFSQATTASLPSGVKGKVTEVFSLSSVEAKL